MSCYFVLLGLEFRNQYSMNHTQIIILYTHKYIIYITHMLYILYGMLKFCNYYGIHFKSKE